MRRTASYLALLLAMTPWTAAFAQRSVRRVAVYDFDDTAVKGEVKEAYGSEKKIGAQVAHRVIADLVNSAEFDVIDRDQIDRIMKEQNMHFSARFDPSEAPKLGKILNVDAIVTGTVEELSSEVTNNKMSLLHVGFGKGQAQARVNVSARVIGTETGRIFLADTVDATAKQDRGMETSYADKGGSSSDSDSAHPRAIAVTAAVNQAAAQLAAKIIARADQMPARQSKGGAGLLAKNTNSGSSPAADSNSASPAPAKQFTAPASVPEILVGKVDGKKVYITAGANAGLKVDQMVEIRRPSGTMQDAAGHVIQINEKVETLVITEVEEQYCIAQARGGTPPLAQKDDWVKLVPTSKPMQTARPAHTTHG
jgi:curli biogenesis system outer membrane secretion channel CsgG